MSILEQFTKLKFMVLDAEQNIVRYNQGSGVKVEADRSRAKLLQVKKMCDTLRKTILQVKKQPRVGQDGKPPKSPPKLERQNAVEVEEPVIIVPESEDEKNEQPIAKKPRVKSRAKASSSN